MRRQWLSGVSVDPDREDCADSPRPGRRRSPRRLKDYSGSGTANVKDERFKLWFNGCGLHCCTPNRQSISYEILGGFMVEMECHNTFEDNEITLYPRSALEEFATTTAR